MLEGVKLSKRYVYLAGLIEHRKKKQLESQAIKYDYKGSWGGLHHVGDQSNRKISRKTHNKCRKVENNKRKT